MIKHVSDVAAAGAERLLQEANRSVSARGRFTLVLSGGSTPLKMYAILSEHHAREAFWAKTHVFWGDERFVPHESPESNYGAAREALLGRLPIPEAQVHPWPYLENDPEGAAAQYADTLRRAVGDLPFDLTFLGLGDDAHTASLFPGTGAVYDEGKTTVVRPAGKGTRLSLTANQLSLSRVIAFLVSGEGKRGALEATLAPADFPDLNRTPARALHAQDELVWLTDVALTLSD